MHNTTNTMVDCSRQKPRFVPFATLYKKNSFQLVDLVYQSVNRLIKHKIFKIEKLFLKI